MSMMNGVELKEMGDNSLDYRDGVSSTETFKEFAGAELWFWPRGYGKEPGITLSHEDVTGMLRGFYDNHSDQPDEVIITVVTMKDGKEIGKHTL